MTTAGVDEIARALVADGKGILAADESPGTITKRFEPRGDRVDPDSRRAYREMFFRTPGVGEFIGGVILQDETIRQRAPTGRRWSSSCAAPGHHPRHQGRRGREGAGRLAGRERHRGPRRAARAGWTSTGELGARFAKWRAVITIGDGLPTACCIARQRATRWPATPRSARSRAWSRSSSPRC